MDGGDPDRPTPDASRARPDLSVEVLPYLVRRALGDPGGTARKFFRMRRTFDDWPFYWSARIFGEPREWVYHLRDGPRMCLRTRTVDFYVVDEVFRLGVYLPRPDWVRRDDIVVDVGAHVGSFTLLAARTATEGRVVALEPQPDNYAMLERNIGLNGCTNVRAYPWAMAGRSGRRLLHLSRENVGGHSFFLESPRSIEVTAKGLEDLVRELELPRIDVLKLDCEGAEHEILEGAPSTLLGGIRNISMEYHELDADRSAGSLTTLLERNGFEAWVSEPKSMIFAQRR